MTGSQSQVRAAVWLVVLALLGCDGSPAADAADAAEQGGASGPAPTAGAGPVAGSGGTGGAAGLGSAGQGGSAGVEAGSGGVEGVAGASTGSGGASGSAGGSGSGGAQGNAGAGGGGSGGSGGGGAGGSGATLGCAAGSYLICEDFEAASVGGTPDGWTKHGDASGVVDDAAHDGSRSLRLDAIPVWERRIYHDASALGSAHWGRIYFRVQLPVPDAFVHSTLVAFSGVGPTRGASEYRVVDTVKQAVDTPDVASRIQFLWNVQPQSSGEFGEGTSYDREFDDAWHCAEWHVDAADQSYAFYLDGEELIAFENGVGNFDGTDIPTSFQELRVGWINYQDAPPGFTAWIDDVAVDDERVGCF